MVNMYKVNIDELYDIKINDNLFICESVSPSEGFRRRELNRVAIINGTQIVTRGQYVPLDITFTTHVSIDPTRPDMYDQVFEEMMSKPAEIISPELGGKFNAQVLIKKEHDKHSMLKLTIQLIEVPDEVSRIPGEGKFVIPEDKLESEEDRLAREGKTKAKEEAKTKGTVAKLNDEQKTTLLDWKSKAKEMMNKRRSGQ